MSKFAEPSIIINGYKLFEAQALAVRVAISNFLLELEDEDFRREMGPSADSYRERLIEVLRFYM